MSDFWRNALELLGVWTPFVYAAATFYLFHFLDARASDYAKTEIGRWLAAEKYREGHAAKAVIEVFDRFYTRPLLGWRAFARSAAISILVGSVVVYEMYPLMFWVARHEPVLRNQWAAQLLTNIMADYFGLFLIRRALVLGRKWPITTLILSPLLGACVVTIAYLMNDVGGYSWSKGVFHFRYLGEDLVWWYHAIANPAGTSRVLLLPAFAVYLWLPLFALGLLGTRAFNGWRWAARLLLPFLKDGGQHPLQAVGYVAALIVFLASAGAKLAGWL